MTDATARLLATDICRTFSRVRLNEELYGRARSHSRKRSAAGLETAYDLEE